MIEDLYGRPDLWQLFFLVGSCRCFEESNLRRCFMSQPIVQSMGAVGDFQIFPVRWKSRSSLGTLWHDKRHGVMVSWGVACLKKTPICFVYS